MRSISPHLLAPLLLAVIAQGCIFGAAELDPEAAEEDVETLEDMRAPPSTPEMGEPGEEMGAPDMGPAEEDMREPPSPEDMSQDAGPPPPEDMGPANCNDDNESCPSGQSCLQDGRCADLLTDPMNCGEADRTCDRGQACAAGMCLCAINEMRSDGVKIIDGLQGDSLHESSHASLAPALLLDRLCDPAANEETCSDFGLRTDWESANPHYLLSYVTEGDDGLQLVSLDERGRPVGQQLNLPSPNGTSVGSYKFLPSVNGGALFVLWGGDFAQDQLRSYNVEINSSGDVSQTPQPTVPWLEDGTLQTFGWANKEFSSRQTTRKFEVIAIPFVYFKLATLSSRLGIQLIVRLADTSAPPLLDKVFEFDDRDEGFELFRGASLNGHVLPTQLRQVTESAGEDKLVVELSFVLPLQGNNTVDYNLVTVPINISTRSQGDVELGEPLTAPGISSSLYEDRPKYTVPLQLNLNENPMGQEGPYELSGWRNRQPNPMSYQNQFFSVTKLNELPSDYRPGVVHGWDTTVALESSPDAIRLLWLESLMPKTERTLLFQEFKLGSNTIPDPIELSQGELYHNVDIELGTRSTGVIAETERSIRFFAVVDGEPVCTP